MTRPIITRVPSNTNWDTFENQNKAVSEWAGKTKDKLKVSASQFKYGKKGTIQRRSKYGAVRDEEKLMKSLRHRLYNKYGITEGVGFKFERHGVFVHKGVGKGYQMVNGMVVRIAKGKPNPRERKPVDWFNGILNLEVPKLADQLATINADASINALRMRIN